MSKTCRKHTPCTCVHSLVTSVVYHVHASYNSLSLYSLYLSLTRTDMPALPPIEVVQDVDPEQGDPDSEWNEPEKEAKFKRTSGPRVMDPYASDESWFMPITIAVAVFLPVLFCLCRVR